MELNKEENLFSKSIMKFKGPSFNVIKASNDILTTKIEILK